MQRVSKILNHFWYDKETFKEVRYNIIPNLPMNLGSLSLGYSNEEIKLYYTKMVPYEGCIDWNLSTIISDFRNALYGHTMTPEIVSLMQSVGNEMMPGFSFDISNTHWFFRPHISTDASEKPTKIGCALIMSTQYNLLMNTFNIHDNENDKNNKYNQFNNFQFLANNFADKIPMAGALFRGISSSIFNGIGTIRGEVFINFTTKTNVFLMLTVKFLFDPSALSSQLLYLVLNNGPSNNNNVQNTSNALSSYNGDNNNHFDNNNDENFEHKNNDNNNDDHQKDNNGNNNNNNNNNTNYKNNINVDQITNYNDFIQNEIIKHEEQTLVPWMQHKWKLMSASIVGVAVSLASVHKIPRIHIPR